MNTDDVHAKTEELQFDRVASDADPALEASRQPAVTCAGCSTTIDSEYYHVNGTTTCERCRDAVAEQLAVPRGWKPFTLATALGIGAAIAGAVVYYAVIAITDFEIGIVAILIGYMVGWAIRKGTAGRGGRRFQILAAVLTYWAVGLAYTPLVFKAANEGDEANLAAVVADSASDSASTAPIDSILAPTTATTVAETVDAASEKTISGDSMTNSAAISGTSAGTETTDDGSLLVAFGALFFLVFALPVMIVAGSLPSGLISAFIIFIGIHQAWRMTGAPALKVSGPYRVGPHPSAARA